MRFSHKRRSLGHRLSWWLALQSFAGLGLVCLSVYLATAALLRERQEELLLQKEAVVRHLLTEAREPPDLASLKHKLDDFLVGHQEMALELVGANGIVLYANAAIKPAPGNSRQREFEVPQVEGVSSIALRARLVLDVQVDTRLLQRLAWTLLAAAIAGAFGISWGGFLLVQLGLAPVRQLADQSRALSAGRLHQRLDDSEQSAELVPLIAQFNALLARIEQAYAQLEGFNADVAHELCTPIATLVASNELALRRLCEGDLQEVLASNLEELHRMTGIVRDMLFLSQADRGVSARRSAVQSLAAVAAEVVDYHEAALAEAGLQVSITGDAAGEFDVPLLHRAISNLLGNATLYATRDSSVQLSIAGSEAGPVSLLVANRGDTIDPVYLPRLFDRFFRGDPARTQSQGNHGLGLAIVAAIARMHNGRPLASSQSGITRIGLELGADARNNSTKP